MLTQHGTLRLVKTPRKGENKKIKEIKWQRNRMKKVGQRSRNTKRSRSKAVSKDTIEKREQKSEEQKKEERRLGKRPRSPKSLNGIRGEKKTKTNSSRDENPKKEIQYKKKSSTTSLKGVKRQL